MVDMPEKYDWPDGWSGFVLSAFFVGASREHHLVPKPRTTPNKQRPSWAKRHSPLLCSQRAKLGQYAQTPTDQPNPSTHPAIARSQYLMGNIPSSFLAFVSAVSADAPRQRRCPLTPPPPPPPPPPPSPSPPMPSMQHRRRHNRRLTASPRPPAAVWRSTCFGRRGGSHGSLDLLDSVVRGGARHCFLSPCAQRPEPERHIPVHVPAPLRVGGEERVQVVRHTHPHTHPSAHARAYANTRAAPKSHQPLSLNNSAKPSV